MSRQLKPTLLVHNDVYAASASERPFQSCGAWTLFVRGWMVLMVIATTLLAQGFAQPAKRGDGIGVPLYTVQPLKTVSGMAVPNNESSPLNTVPVWLGKFQYVHDGAARVFPYSMVGTNPWAGSATTTVPTEIVPLALIFSNGVSLDGTARVADTIASPLFQPFLSQTGFTQYGDAVTRASFHSVVQERSPDWHVLLGKPSVLATHTITVPPEEGFEFTGTGSGARIGLVNLEWFTQRIRSLLAQLDLDPRTLPIFLTYNSFLFSENPKNCCVIGFHSAIASPGPGDRYNVNTFVWASYNDRGIFDRPIEDITALSHEVAEWYHDPLVRNLVPAWPQPGSGACFSNIMEVGDAIESFPDLSFVVNMRGVEYHPQDVALFSWFSRQRPSMGLKGRYSYRGAKLAGPAPTC
jgi:hypothetical protein